eukprot:Hpha_TRINITY_DN26290_c0_g1::TRINITY_DN26290_c0_g1_i1::g.184816::m.184816/K15537/AGMO; alkylglycerol monooxygenase
MNVTAEDAGCWLTHGFATMFYALPPTSLALAPGETAPDLIANPGIPMFIILMLLEWIAGLVLTPKRKIYYLNDTMSSISMGGVQQLLNIVMMIGGVNMAVGLYEIIWTHYRIAEMDVKAHPYITWLVCLLWVDCGYYWAHRLMHVFHAGWAGHGVHHTGEHYNLATALRQGAIQQLFSWLPSLPLALFIPPPTYKMHSHLNTLYQFWIHTELVGRLGIFEYFMNTPFHHRMHHRPPGNCNYAGVLIIWDRMFGTQVPEVKHIDRYGWAQSAGTFDPVGINFVHWKRMGRIPVPKSFGWLRAAFTRAVGQRTRHPWTVSLSRLFKPYPDYVPGDSPWTLGSAPDRVQYKGTTRVERKVVAVVAFLISFGSVIKLLDGYSTAVEGIFKVLGATIGFKAMGRVLDGGPLLEGILGAAVAGAVLVYDFPQ